MQQATRNRQFALVSAAIYLAAGVLGFFVTGFDGLTADTDDKLVILGLSPLHKSSTSTTSPSPTTGRTSCTAA